jgi:hypothetical protein
MRFGLGIPGQQLLALHGDARPTTSSLSNDGRSRRGSGTLCVLTQSRSRAWAAVSEDPSCPSRNVPVWSPACSAFSFRLIGLQRREFHACGCSRARSRIATRACRVPFVPRNSAQRQVAARGSVDCEKVARQPSYSRMTSIVSRLRDCLPSHAPRFVGLWASDPSPLDNVEIVRPKLVSCPPE